jgi:putative phosphoribosyl transferase
MTFRDREDAGRRLAQALAPPHPGIPAHPGTVVVGLPRGGVKVAFEVACALGAPLDVIVVRKLGVPFEPELAMGAIAEGGMRVVNDEVVRRSGVGPAAFAEVEAREQVELERRARRLRGDRPGGEKPRAVLRGRTVIVVDDGLATGSTASVACRAVRAQGAARVVLAVPVAPRETIRWLWRDADDIVCLETPSPFVAIGNHYADFSQTRDDEVIDLLRRREPPAAPESS